MTIKFKRKYKDTKLPAFALDPDSTAGLDLSADGLNGENQATTMGHALFILHPGTRMTVSTGISWDPETRKGYKTAMVITGRSGLSKEGVVVMQGLIDPSYRGEIMITLVNMGGLPKIIRRGDRIAQGVVVLLPLIDIEETDELPVSDRGTAGFGSTGT